MISQKMNKVLKNKGFGSSDCNCLTYLFYIKDKEKIEKVLSEKGFSKRMEFESYDNN